MRLDEVVRGKVYVDVNHWTVASGCLACSGHAAVGIE